MTFPFVCMSVVPRSETYCEEQEEGRHRHTDNADTTDSIRGSEPPTTTSPSSRAGGGKMSGPGPEANGSAYSGSTIDFFDAESGRVLKAISASVAHDLGRLAAREFYASVIASKGRAI
jgi:hypothetical protein